MHASFSRTLAVLAIVALTLPALSQTSAGSQTGPCKVLPGAKPMSIPHPSYTAEFKTTVVRTLGNGATITQESSMVQARDSQSRSFHSTTMTQPYIDHTPTTMVNVQDPVAGTQSNWDSRSRKARVIKLPPLEERHGCWQTPSGNFRQTWGNSLPGSPVAPVGAIVSSAQANAAVLRVQRPKPVMEDLGAMTIEGVEAHGQRWTTTTPAGEIGNDQPLVSTQENWIAMELGGLQVRSVSDDPQQGKRTMELVKLEQGEPDPALFQPPEGYEVVPEEMVPCKEQATSPQ
jgi:hypothetical protein